MRPDSERICFAKQSEQWTSSPRSVMSGGVFNRKTPEIGKDFSSEKSSRTDHSPKGCALRSKVCFSSPLLKQSLRDLKIKLFLMLRCPEMGHAPANLAS